MIDFTSTRRTIEMYLDSNFTTVPIVFENVGVPEDADEFIAVRDAATDSQQMELGGDVVRKDGVLLIDIYTPLDNGTNRSRVLADELAALIELQQISDVAFRESELHTVGPVGDAEYFHQVLQTPYSVFYGQNEALC